MPWSLLLGSWPTGSGPETGDCGLALLSGVMAASGAGLLLAGGAVDAGGVDGGGVVRGGVAGAWPNSPTLSTKTARVMPMLYGKHLDPEAAERMKFLHRAS